MNAKLKGLFSSKRVLSIHFQTRVLLEYESIAFFQKRYGTDTSLQITIIITWYLVTLLTSVVDPE